MNKFSFNLSSDEELILLPVLLDGYEVQLALDTAATQTIIDFNVLLMLGYSETDASGSHTLETAGGYLDAQVFRVSELSALNKSIGGFDLLSYDFLKIGLLSSYDGVLGLDFFRPGGRLTIDFDSQELWFSH
jgi:hypothetical protein